MEWLLDSKACIEAAEEMIDEIDSMIPETIKYELIMPYLKVKIKNCLENCNSPLDYVANHIFNEYCIKEYTVREIKRHKTYFPKPAISEDVFGDSLKNNFRLLKCKRADIVEVLEESQPYKGDTWLNNLNVLLNENKHRNLSRQIREQTVNIKQGSVFGINMSNVTFTTSETFAKIGETKIDLINPTPYDHLIKGASVSYEFYFKDLMLPVIPTIKAIQVGAKRVIEEMEKIL